MFGALTFGGGPFAGTSGAAPSLMGSAGLQLSATAALTTTARLSAAATIALATSASLTVRVDLAARAELHVGTAATLSTPFGVGITIGGVNVQSRVRMAGLSIRDVLNDAPNTARLTLAGDPPALGQALKITIGSAPPRVLFAGTVQSIEQRYESRADRLAWDVTAIDDTGRANAKRPFGVWVDVSATAIAQAITATFAPGFSPAGIAAALPAVSIVFDGADTFIAALVRLANLVGGYAKIEDNTVYLFLEDAADPPAALTPAAPPLNAPPITIASDASQLRTRVYGKGYGESLRADVGAGETLLPIQDGSQFPTAGGQAIIGTTPEGAQAIRLGYTGVTLQGPGTLVGPGAAPGVSPLVAIAGGSGVSSGLHTVTVVFFTANGRSLPGPAAEITVGMLPGPAVAAIAGAALPGTGPDQGVHDYWITYLTAFGETNTGAVTNAIETSAASGQLAAPGAPTVNNPQSGSGPDEGTHDYRLTFVNAEGETEGGAPSGFVTTTISGGGLSAPGPCTTQPCTQGAGVDDGTWYYAVTFTTAAGETTAGPASNGTTAGPQLVGQTSPVSPGGIGTLTPGFGGALNVNGNQVYRYRQTFTTASGESLPGTEQSRQLAPKLPTPGAPFIYFDTTGGGLTPGATYYYRTTFRTAQGETLGSVLSNGMLVASGKNALSVSSGGTSDTRVTAVALYRRTGAAGADHLVRVTQGHSGTGQFTDTQSDASIASQPAPPTTDTTVIENSITVTLATSADARVTGRKLYRSIGNESSANHLLATIPNNTQTSWVDTAADTAIQNAGPPPTVDSTANPGTMTPFNQLPIVNIPLGPAGTTGRRLYRGAQGTALSQFRLVATITNNAGTTYLDTLPSSSLGGFVPPSNTTGTPFQRVPLSNLALGPAGTTGRRLYRRFNFAGTFKRVHAFGDNTTTTYTDSTTNSGLGVDCPTSNTTGSAVQKIPLTQIPIGPLGVTARKIYRRFNQAGAAYLVNTLADNKTTAWTDTVPNSARGAAYTGVNTAVGNQIAVTGIPLGTALVTGRELYLSPAGGGPRRWAGVTLVDNTTTAATITISDAALAANPLEPTSDTSGLSQPTGQVNPGSTTLPLAAAGTFPLTGWVLLAGGQTVRYTGISGQTLTGIPPAGPGAITTTLLFGSQALPAPMLTGVTGVPQLLLKGSAVHIWVQRDDLQAQAEERARAGGDGIIEYLITDARRGQDSLIERCDADLQLFSRPIVTVGYACRDVRTKSGKPITIALPGFTLPEPLIIQDVTITEIERAANLAPRFTVRASTVRFSLEDVLRRLIAGGTGLERI